MEVLSKGPNWQRHELEIQQRLGLSSTIGSGNKFHDPSDGTDKKHHSEHDFQVMIDAKSTSKKSYRLSRRLLKDWREKALVWGKIFMLPLRFEYEDESTDDWIILHIDDFSEMYELARRPQKVEVVDRKRTSEAEDHIENLETLVKRIKDPEVKLELFSTIEFLEREFKEEKV